jgi:hypothetical protein
MNPIVAKLARECGQALAKAAAKSARPALNKFAKWRLAKLAEKKEPKQDTTGAS